MLHIFLRVILKNWEEPGNEARHPCGEGSPLSRVLDQQNRSKDAYFAFPINTQEPQTVSQILVAELGVRVYLPPFWPFYSTEGVHQAPTPSCGHFEITWDLLCHLFPDHAPGQGDGDQAHAQLSCGFAGGFGFPSQLSQVIIGATSDN